MTTVTYTAAQKTSLTDQAKRWQDHMVSAIMSEEFDADENSFRNLFQETLNFSRLELMSETSTEVPTGKRQKRMKRVKRVKDPNAPTKPPTPYILFLWGDKTAPDLLGNGKVNALKSDNADMVHKDAVSQAAAAWKVLSVEDKTPYVERNAALKTLYTTAMETYTSDSDNTTTEPETYTAQETEPDTETAQEPEPDTEIAKEPEPVVKKTKNTNTKKTKAQKN
jgi:hypothetical protein